jgi:hypothetical protein
LPENLLGYFDFAVPRLPIDVFFSFRRTPGCCATSAPFRSAWRRAQACNASLPSCRSSSVTRRSASAAFSTSPAAFSTTDQGRTASCPTAPSQIPACEITAPGSSVLLALHTSFEYSEIMAASRFGQFKIVQ